MSNLHFNALPANTAALLRQLEHVPEIAGFVLIGETAVALHLGHRISHDLDFATLDPKLDRSLLDRIVRALRTSGLEVERVHHVAREQEFVDKGLDLDDYQQDFLVGRGDGAVKLTFFSPDARQFLTAGPTFDRGQVRIASPHALGVLKAAVLPERCTIRDLVDLHALLAHQHLAPSDAGRAIARAGHAQNLGFVLDIRIPNAGSEPDDPSVEPIGVAPDLRAIKNFFSGLRSQILQGAAEFLGEGPPSNTP